MLFRSEAAQDPHPQYQTQAEGDARYATAAQGIDAREWTADTISQVEAEAGTATTRRAFTALRVFQAVAAWWAGSAAASKLAGIASGATANATDAQLRDRSTHTGTQAAGTITGLAAVATTGAYSDLSGRPMLGTAAATDSSAYATAAQGAKADTAVQPAGLSSYVTTSDARLSDARTPSDGSVTDAKVASGGLSASSINWAAITAWAPSTAYAKGDLVEYLGIAYRRSAAGTSGASFNASNWQQITPSEVVAHPASKISDSTTAGRSLLTAADAAAQRTALGLGTAATTAASAYATAAQGAKADTAVQPGSLATVATSGSYADLSNKPTIAALSDATPQAPGTASSGTASTASRSDHRHDLPAVVSTSSAGLRPALAFDTITYGATTDLDLSALNGAYKSISLTGNITFTTSNRANGRTLVLRVICDSTQRTLTFPSGWVFVGTKPANIAASKTGVLSLTFFGTADSDCVAAWGVQS